MRKPLMAGNWKMNLNHLEAIAVAQKLVYSLNDADYFSQARIEDTRGWICDDIG